MNCPNNINYGISLYIPAITDETPIIAIAYPIKTENFLPFASARPGNKNMPIMQPNEYIDCIAERVCLRWQ